MQNKMKNLFSVPIIFLLAAVCMHCSKQNAVTPIEQPPVIPASSVSFKQDTLPLTLSVTTARKEIINSLISTAIEAKMPDSTAKKNSLIIRVMADSARAYSNTEILASYTDSTGIVFSNIISDTLNKVIITKLEKKKNGLVQGSFTIRVSNSTKTKNYLLKEGVISSSFTDY
jgi:hypothetical protein